MASDTSIRLRGFTPGRSVSGTDVFYSDQGSGEAAVTADQLSAYANGKIDPANLNSAAALTGSELSSVKQAGGWFSLTVGGLAAFILSLYTIFIVSGVGAVARTIIAKILDLPVSVKDFGAKGDGVTNDTTAFANAQLSGMPVYVPYTANGYVIGNLDVTGIVYSDGRTQLIPAAGSSWMVRVLGYNARFRGFTINDINGAVVAQSTLSGAQSQGATTVQVASGTGYVVGQRVMIEGSGGMWHSTWITGVSGTTLTLQTGLAYAASSGARVWASFGAVYITANTSANVHALVEDLTFPNMWAGVMLDCGQIVGGADVSMATVRRIRCATGRLFGVIKGRNVHDCSFSDIRMFGGWGVSASYTGDGATTSFSVSDNIWLTRELTVKVGGVVKTVGTDYTFTGPRTIQFTTAPTSGAAISLSGWTYGADGLVDDGQSLVTACGGNTYDAVYGLQWMRGAKLRVAQLFQFGVCAFDTCSESAMELNGVTYLGQMANVFLGYAPILLNVINGSAGTKIFPSVYNLLPSGVSVAGSGGVLVNCDSTSNVDFPGALTLLAYSANTTVGSNTTGYIGPLGYQSNSGAGAWNVPYAGLALKFSAGCGTAPGSGQSFTYNLMKNGSTVATLTISGTGTYNAVTFPASASFNAGDGLSVQLVTSASANQAQHRIAVSFG